MENASKALIIAGAILLSILIIAIGMYIYNSSQNSISGAVTQISQQEIDAFNQPWEMYEGKQSGSNVRALISKLNSNATQNAEEETKLPNLYYEATAQNVGAGAIVASTIVDPKGSNTEVTGAAAEATNFNTARTRIEQNHVYGVTLVTHETTGLISGVIITYNPDEVVVSNAATNILAHTLYEQFAEDDEIE